MEKKTKECKIKANVAYNRRQDSITLRPAKEDGAKVRRAAEAAGLPLQRYVMAAAIRQAAADADGAVLVAIPRAKIAAGAERTGKTAAEYIAALEK